MVSGVLMMTGSVPIIRPLPDRGVLTRYAKKLSQVRDPRRWACVPIAGPLPWRRRGLELAFDLRHDPPAEFRWHP
jgi:hypothetical protein